MLLNQLSGMALGSLCVSRLWTFIVLLSGPKEQVITVPLVGHPPFGERQRI